jgi:CubicO group peptidase (beta-lactamase class C family)
MHRKQLRHWHVRGQSPIMLKRRVVLAAGSASLVASTSLAQGDARIEGLLAELMHRRRVPDASLAVIRDGAIAERIAVSAGERTLFQAASISKVVTGVIVMRLVEQGRIGLDTPVNEMLRSWTLPGPGAERVTPRLLLSHRGGTTVAGFPGYAVGAPLPTLAEILDGTPPANTRGVRVAWPPGEAFRYSGGGTMVLQRLVMDVAAQSFDALAGELALAPAGMSRSAFSQPLPAAESNAASAYDLDGNPLAGRYHVYPEHAAAGLWSTPSDLARLALAIGTSWRTGGLLKQATAELMATRVANGPTGLGLFVHPRDGKPPYLYHYGVNAGFRSVLVFAADASFGVALMTNGEGGKPLIPAMLAVLFDGQDPFRPGD